MKKSVFLLLAISLIWSCAPKKYSAILLPETEYVNLDTLTITAPSEYEGDPISLDEMGEEPVDFTERPYNASAKREADLLHTKLDLRFDWAKEQVMGKATLTLKPYFYPTDKVVLDAKGFQFHKINLEGSAEQLKYDYDSSQVTIHLGKTYTRNQEYKLYLDYTATPAASGGSAAITSDKGLFFINPRKEEGDKPQQIWTQGETENNSRWFPTIDKPNERATNEITLTVEDRFKTLSNGVLVSSKKNTDGTRTDHWKMDMPHAPYLVMIAVGEFAVVSEKWNGKPVDYYVEPKFEKYAKNIFPHTPEMLQFFSDKLGVNYPWQKYSQVVVRDYVSGAMENTTAVIFGEFMQGTDRQLVDARQNETIVAHEMFHHWFGDYVTCESWSNLTLNEGFANYSEYLWLEKKHGRDEADFHRLQEMNGYMQSAAQAIHPLIDYGYANKEDMFDAHSYNKGGLILHMLRNYVGDDAFFTALQYYLKKNAFTEVEADELRLAFEDVTGEDLNWFFNQWFFEKGQPALTVEYDYDEEAKEVNVIVVQTQDPKEMPAVFTLPVGVDVYVDGKVTRHNLRIDQRQQTFKIPAAKDPELIVFDGDGVLLADVTEDKSQEEYIYQYKNASNFQHKIRALGEIVESESPEAKAVVKGALDDKFWLFRLFAIESAVLDGQVEDRIAVLAEKDPHSDVRESAMRKLGSTEDKKYAPLAARAVEKDPAIKVVSAALETLLALDKEAALTTAKKLEKEDDEGIILALAGLYSEAGDPQRLSFFEEKFSKVTGYNQVGFIQSYTKLAQNADAAAMLRTANKIKAVAMNEGNMFWLRFMVTKSINEMHATLAGKIEEENDAAKKADIMAKDAELVKAIEAIKAWEKDDRVMNMYEAFPDPAPKP
ncbi:MAG: alanyl aminopeptidase [Saprospiraceae bacterium]|nr:alanyl aminopeptidase [Saprospiraceae bacterium]